MPTDALAGREQEQAMLERVLDDAQAGRSGVLAVVGEVGMGKSALLDHAVARASAMNVLRARGIESEARIPFAGLFELLRPALGDLDRIAPPQRAALEGALALRPAQTQDRFAVGAATLSLLAAYADDAPLLVVVDDAHWLDGSSADALLFAFRRLMADSIAVVVAVRAGEPSLLDGTDLPVHHLEGLDRAATATLVAAHAVDDVVPSEALIDRLHRGTGGNPLALIELASDGDAISTADPFPSVLPVGARVARAYVERCATLREPERDLLLLAAISDSGDLAMLAKAAASVGLDITDLDAAEAIGLITVRNDQVEFRHPLVRSSVQADASAERRRAMHRAFARSLPDADADRRAWHLALAALGPDETASSALEQAGQRARARSAYDVASRAFERAGALATTDVARGALLHAAADCAWLGGLAQRAVALLDDARRHATEPEVAIAVEHLRGHIATRLGPVGEGHRILLEGAELAAEIDPDRAVVMLAEAVNAGFYAGDVTAMETAAARIGSLLGPGASRRTRFFADIACGMALIFGGDDAGEGAELVRAAVALVEGSDELADDPRLLAWAAMGPLWLRESERRSVVKTDGSNDGVADAGAAIDRRAPRPAAPGAPGFTRLTAESGRLLVDRALDLARQQSAVGVLPFLLSHVAVDDAAADRWAQAEAGFHEAIALARESGQRTDLAFALARLAWLEGRQGREAECRAHVAEARELDRKLGMGVGDIWLLAAVGDLELGLGNVDRAAEQYEALRAGLLARGVGDVDLFPDPELVEIDLRTGHRDRAVERLASFDERAAAKGQPWSLARAARVHGVLADDDAIDEPFTDALAWHAQTPDGFETARTRLAYGRRLRRARQRVRAREQLDAALVTFEHLGATPWAEMTRAELAATGATARRRDVSTRDHLTPQELQIALRLASGQTTREAAAGLFLSPKTIEYHLRSVYRKLAISSRAELTAAMAAIDGTEPEAGP